MSARCIKCGDFCESDCAYCPDCSRQRDEREAEQDERDIKAGKMCPKCRSPFKNYKRVLCEYSTPDPWHNEKKKKK